MRHPAVLTFAGAVGDSSTVVLRVGVMRNVSQTISARVAPATTTRRQMRSRAFRRHQAERHMRRRLQEDRNG